MHKTLILLFFLLSQNTFAQKSSTDSIKINGPAPKFVLQSLEGEYIFLRDYCGELRQPWKNKTKYIVILSFFTTYCQPCLKEIPELEKLSDDKNLKIFLVNLKESKKIVSKFIEEKTIKLPVLLDKYGVVANKYGVTSVPRIFIINQEGILIWKIRGYTENLSEQIIKLLEK